MYRIGDEEDVEEEDKLFLQGFDRIELNINERRRQEQRKKRLKYAMAGAATLVTLLIVVSLAVGLARKAALPYICNDEQGAQYSLTFFVIGDWGRQGNRNQRHVASMMSDVAQCMPPNFIISTGDNFYSHGLSSPSDPNFQSSFVKVYDSPALQVPWYAVLGNHDMGNGISPEQNSDCAAYTLDACPKDCCYSPEWQYTGRVNDVRWHCQNGTYGVPTGNPALLDIIMMDTNPFLEKYKKETWYKNAGGIWQQDPTEIRSQVRRRLTASRAAWKLVVGHHPIASYGQHCDYTMQQDCEDMAWLEKEMQAVNAAAYLCGHDHDLQYIYRPSDPANPDSPPTWPVFAVSGAGSDIRDNEFDKVQQKDDYKLGYQADDQGFVAARVNATHLVLHYYVKSHAEPAYTAVLAQPRQGKQPPLLPDSSTAALG